MRVCDFVWLCVCVRCCVCAFARAFVLSVCVGGYACGRVCACVFCV